MHVEVEESEELSTEVSVGKASASHFMNIGGEKKISLFFTK